MTAEQLKAFCKERGLTYAQLAEKIGNSEATCETKAAFKSYPEAIVPLRQGKLGK